MSVAILDPRGEWLRGKEYDETSQFGEDGLIEALFERIGTRNRWCFEVGAWDGLELSNTKRLRDAGWQAILIEKDDRKFQELAKLASESVSTIHSQVTPTTLDQILDDCGAPFDLDLGVIDIDCQDFWVWAGMQHRPRVMLVEFKDGDDNCISRLNNEETSIAKEAGRHWIIDLGRAKGYVPLVATTVNALFCKQSIVDEW